MMVKTLAQIKDVEGLNCVLNQATNFYSKMNVCHDSKGEQTSSARLLINQNTRSILTYILLIS